MPNIKLLSSKFSPYSHRVEMALIEKNIPYEKEIIDLQNKPEKFVEDSPLGKVPLIYFDDKILFESIAICEYLEEAFVESPLHPSDIFIKATHRAWMELSNSLMAATFGLIWSKNQLEFDQKKIEIDLRLKALDRYLKFSPYFEGEKFHLVDICLASALKPLSFIDVKFTLEVFDRYPSAAAYAENVITRGSLSKVLPKDYEDIFKSYLERKSSHLLTMSFAL